MHERERQREKQAPRREPHVGLDPGTPESCPVPKAGTKPLSHPGTPIFNFFWGTSTLFSRVVVSFCIPTNSARGFLFLHILTNICCFLSCSFSPFSLVSHCGFHLYFPDGKWCRAFFHVPFGHVYVFLGEMSVHVFCPFNDWIFLFLGCWVW